MKVERMVDTYKSFSELKQHETDYSFERRDRGSDVTILAPHGGLIEPHTTEIARLIAADDYNYFCFNGLKQGSNQDLHITSTRYDETRALELVQKSQTVIAVHGCALPETMVFVGGLDRDLRELVTENLEERNIPSMRAGRRYGGLDPNNICNRGLSGGGVQLEISRPLRDNPKAWVTLAESVRQAVKTRS